MGFVGIFLAEIGIAFDTLTIFYRSKNNATSKTTKQSFSRTLNKKTPISSAIAKTSLKF